jgi:murein L,D-transpeptidase YcbB/YkuD
MLLKTISKHTLLGVSLAILAPQFSWAYGESTEIQKVVDRAGIVQVIKPRTADFMLHTDMLNKLYSQRGYQAIWVDGNGQPTALANSLKTTLGAADRHGLQPSDYWDQNMEKAYQALRSDPRNWLTFELTASETLIRYARHLSTGRFDPEQVDNDIKFKQRDFAEYNQIAAAVNAGPFAFMNSMDQLQPVNPRYKDLMDILARLRQIQAQGGWGTIALPKVALKKGMSNTVVGQIRKRLAMLGYQVSRGGDYFDNDFEADLKAYQERSAIKPDGMISSASSSVIRFMNYSVEQRIAQVEVTMEKLRWLPRDMETRHIFVNLATTEFRLFDETGARIFYFKTVNGQPQRRTPSMKDKITYVNLNPTWTVPPSIAFKDKLPKLRENPNYLQEHDMTLIDANTGKEIDSAGIDWNSVTAKDLNNFYIRQGSGADNALGVVKFPLQNPWSIYMHDTNERDLFAEAERHRSSGCVRLEKPLELAAYLLRDQPQWTLDALKAEVPADKNDNKPVNPEKNVTLKKAMPVYFMYLTVEKEDDGAIRFVDDVYGQDFRLATALANKRASNELF